MNKNLAITALGQAPDEFLNQFLDTISHNHCNILEIRSTILATETLAIYALAEGQWNHIEKLKNNLDGLEKKFNLKLLTLDTEVCQSTKHACIPYRLETISIDHNDITADITRFLHSHQILIKEIQATCFSALFSKTPLFSTKFTLLIPASVQLNALREELVDFCDKMGLDAAFEPIKSI